MTEEGVTYVDATPHPDFSMAYRVWEALQEAGCQVVSLPYEGPPDPDTSSEADLWEYVESIEPYDMVHVIKIVMTALRKYGPDYRRQMEVEDLEKDAEFREDCIFNGKDD